MGPTTAVASGHLAAVPAPGSHVDAAAVFALPAPPHGLVRRPRLEAVLDEGVLGPLTLVTAPAGTGKTVLVSSWAQRLTTSHALVWLSLDDHGISAAAFWQLVSTGLARTGVGRPLPADRRRRTDTATASPESTADAILLHAVPVVLVLDCDAVPARDVTSALAWLMVRCGSRLRTVLLAREDPLLPLHRYRLDEALVEVRMADLAFTPGEARQLLVGMGVDLSSAAMDAMVERTRGWVAGLRLAGMSLAHRADREAAARDFAGDTGTVAEYLLAEVLDTQPEGLRQLLLDTSVVDVLRPGLAAALAGPQAERALGFLAHGNAFLEELPDDPRCYRYHHLFRELLRAQLVFESPTRSVELHRAAAAWLAEHGWAQDAVRHAVQARDWEAAARCAVDDLAVVTLLTGQSSEPLHDLLSRIPPAADGAAVAIVSAARALAVGDLAGGTADLARAHEALGGRAGSWPAGELSLALVELAQAQQRGDAQAALGAATAAQHLLGVQDPERVAAHPEVPAVVSAGLGAALVHLGRPGAAAKAFAAAALEDERAGRTGPLAHCLAQGALLAGLGGELQRAADLASRALRLTGQAGPALTGVAAAAETALAHVHVERYDLPVARQHVARAVDRVPDPHDPLVHVVLGLSRTRLHRASGDLERAAELVADCRARTGLPSWLDDLLGLEQAVPVEDPPPSAVPAPVASRVDGLVLAAARHAAQGDERAAVRELDQALRLAAPELSRRAFRQAPAPVWRVLRQHDALRGRHAWLTDRHTAAGVPTQRRGPSAAPAQLYQPLTDKEREVLGHLAELLTTEEIAATMYISVNTVRTHVRSILRKLGATRRNEAVRRARDLRVLPG